MGQAAAVYRQADRTPACGQLGQYSTQELVAVQSWFSVTQVVVLSPVRCFGSHLLSVYRWNRLLLPKVIVSPYQPQWDLPLLAAA